MGFAQYVKQLYNGAAPDLGQVYYVVDSDFRTAAQGWSRADGTGPLDLWGQRNPGYVFRTGDYTRDQLAIQDAIDQTIDNRGDIISFTPGSYSIATTALAINSRGLRLLGPPVRNPRRSLVTITDAIGDGLAVSVADVELGFLTLVPLTATNIIDVANGADYGYLHDLYYNADGVGASTSTEFVRTAATTTGWLIERVRHLVDAAQGDAYTLVGADWWEWDDCTFVVDGGTWASVFTFVTTASQGCVVRNSRTVSAGGSSLITNVFTGMSGANILKVHDFRMDGTATPTAGNIETGFDATTGIEVAECYLTGDATGEGGALVTLT